MPEMNDFRFHKKGEFQWLYFKEIDPASPTSGLPHLALNPPPGPVSYVEFPAHQPASPSPFLSLHCSFLVGISLCLSALSKIYSLSGPTSSKKPTLTPHPKGKTGQPYSWAPGQTSHTVSETLLHLFSSWRARIVSCLFNLGSNWCVGIY